jgi:hypothetical protein
MRILRRGMDQTIAHEVAKIEHELELLRESYATMVYWARVLKVFIWSLTIPLACVIAYAMYTDVLAGIVFMMASLAVIALIWISRDIDTQYRWIDFATPRNLGWFGPWPRRGDPISEAQAVEFLITEREQRLAELKRASP